MNNYGNYFENSYKLESSDKRVLGDDITETRLLEDDVAISHYNVYLRDKIPNEEFSFVSGRAMVFLCNYLGIWLSIWFIVMGWLEFFIAHTITTLILIYLIASAHYVELYYDTNQYAFIRRKILTGKERITIYQRMEFDYISHKKIGKQEWSHAKHYYAINDKNQNHILELYWKQYNYKINEFSEKFNFEFRDESGKQESHSVDAQAT